MKEFNVLSWKEKTEQYETYWNDENVKSVSNNIDKEGYIKLEEHITEYGFITDFSNCIKGLKKIGKKLSGTGIDLASGSMWFTAHIMQSFGSQIERLYSLDYSERYIFNLGQKLLTHYKVNPEKLFLCLGSFYDIKLPSESLDFVVMSQAFHHADNPDKLLEEARRVLKKDGFLIMIGELYIGKFRYLKCYLNYVLSRAICSKYFPNFFVKSFKKIQEIRKKELKGSFQSLYFPPDPQTGDHYHLKSQYERFFVRNHFNFIPIKSVKPYHLAYVLYQS